MPEKIYFCNFRTKMNGTPLPGKLHNLMAKAGFETLDLRDKFGQTFVIVTHDETLASITDRTIKMRDGLLEIEPQQETPSDSIAEKAEI